MSASSSSSGEPSSSASQSPTSCAGRPFVRQARERAELLRARRAALGRHHHELIPRREHLHGRQIRQLGHAVAQLFQGVHRVKRMDGPPGKRDENGL